MSIAPTAVDIFCQKNLPPCYTETKFKKEKANCMNANKFFNTKKGGFVFIDALMAIVLLSIGIVALLAAYTQSTKVSIAATERQTALYLAQSKLELLKQQYDGTSNTISAYTDTVTTNNKAYKITTNISSRPTAISAYTKIIPLTVTISWNADDSLALTEYIYVK